MCLGNGSYFLVPFSAEWLRQARYYVWAFFIMNSSLGKMLRWRPFFQLLQVSWKELVRKILIFLENRLKNFVSGIVASLLMRKVESRYLVMAGAVLACIGVAFASQATDFVQMIICLGILNGEWVGI